MSLVDPSILAVRDDHDRNDLVEALLHHNRTAQRIPTHWVKDKARIHQRLNDLLTELEAMDHPKPLTAQTPRSTDG